MSTIYRNTVIGLGLNSVYRLTSSLFRTQNNSTDQQDAKTLEKNYALPLIVSGNVIDMFRNPVQTKNESVCCKKVFFSASQESHENCSVEQKELNYIKECHQLVCLL